MSRKASVTTARKWLLIVRVHVLRVWPVEAPVADCGFKNCIKVIVSPKLDKRM